MSGGSIGESLILDFTRYMNKLINFGNKTSPDTFTQVLGSQSSTRPFIKVYRFSFDRITVEPGMYYRDFEKITLEKGMILPCYTASKSINAVGGMYGNNSAGERTLSYSKTEEFVAEAKVVFRMGIYIRSSLYQRRNSR